MINRIKYVIILKSGYYKLKTSKIQTKSKSVKKQLNTVRQRKGYQASE